MGLIQKQMLQGTAITYVGIVVGLLTTGFLLPNLIHKDQIGLIQLLGSLSIILTQFANLGISGAGGRFFPYFRDYDRGHGGFLLVAVTVSSIGFLGCAGILWLAHDWLVAENNDQSGLFGRYFYLLLPLTLFTLFFNLFDTYARLLYDSVTGTFLRDVGQRVFFLGAVVAHYLGWINFYGLLWGWLGSYLLALLFMIGNIIRQGHFTLNPANLNVTPDLRRSMVQYAGLTLLTGLSTQLILHIDKLLVFKATNLANTGVYGISANFGAVIVAPALILYKVSGVIIADSWKRNDLENIQLVYEKSCLSQLIIGGLVFVGIAANLPSVFLFLPKGYEAGYYVILWVGLSKLFDMATGVNGQIIITSKHYAWDSLFILIMVALTIVITPALLRRFGLEGAAIGAAITIGLFNLSRTLFIWYRFGLQPFTWRNIAVIGIALLVWAVAVWPPYVTDNKLTTLIDMALRSVGIVGLYMGLIFAFRIYPDLNLMVGKYFK